MAHVVEDPLEEGGERDERVGAAALGRAAHQVLARVRARARRRARAAPLVASQRAHLAAPRPAPAATAQLLRRLLQQNNIGNYCPTETGFSTETKIENEPSTWVSVSAKTESETYHTCKNLYC